MQQDEPVDISRGDLRVSDNGRFLVHEDGTPFFYLGDTAWELFHRLTRDEAEQYLENRRRKGFTVIQAVALAEMDGLHIPNAYGATPLIDDDPGKPRTSPDDYDYWDHVDWVVDKACEKGMYIGLLPTWGDKVQKAWGVGPVVLNVENARVYGRWIGERYKDKSNIIWIMGGDRRGKRYTEIWNAMAEGIKSVDSRHLMTYHPWGIYLKLMGWGGNSSGIWFHKEPWLDFNMMQSSHLVRNQDNYRRIAHDYVRKPAKPCMDGEPNYEDSVLMLQVGKKTRRFRDHDVRKAAYWSVFAGSHGHTYGSYSVCLFISRDSPKLDIFTARLPIEKYWDESLDRPGAAQMVHLCNLMESRPFLTRIPDQGLIASRNRLAGKHLQATRSSDGDYAMVYVPTSNQSFTVDVLRLAGKRLIAWWYDPRTGKAKSFDEFDRVKETRFTSPADGPDWVLVLDNVSRGFPEPGSPLPVFKFL